MTSIPSLRRIVCPVDFSEFSRHALDHALALARWSGAGVTAVHVVPPVTYSDAVMAPALVYTPEDCDGVRQELRQFISEECENAAVDVSVIEGSAPAAAIVGEANTLNADLIVIGTHGRSGLERLMLGSVTEKILRKASCPVLTVPSAVPDAVPIGPQGFTHILCGVDFTPACSKALAYAAAFARDTHARLTLMHVSDVVHVVDMESSAVVDAAIDSAVHDAARRRLDEIAPAGVTVNKVIGRGKAHRELLQYASDERADLIVLGVHGGPSHLFGFGSTTSHVIRTATCPVLSLRA